MWPSSRRPAQAAVPDIDVREAFTRSRRGARLVDVRSPREFRAAHPKGARNVPPESIARDETGLGHDDELLVICLSGRRSAKAARLFAEAGYANVSNVHGGLAAWKKAGLPVQS